MRAAQQPGAPGRLLKPRRLTRELMRIVFREGMSTDYTSYSPMTQSWTEDLKSVRDYMGRQVLLLPERPVDLEHNPKAPYIMLRGLVMLNTNNRPVKDYPGAPQVMSTHERDIVVEGLRRVCGMTVSE